MRGFKVFSILFLSHRLLNRRRCRCWKQWLAVYGRTGAGFSVVISSGTENSECVCVHRKREHPGANFKYLSFSFFLSLPQLLRLFSKTKRLELAYYSTGRRKAKWMRESESRGKASHRHQLSLSFSLIPSGYLSLSLFAVQTPPLSLFPSVAVPSSVGRREWDWEKVSQSVSRQFWRALLSSCLPFSHLLAPPKQQSRPILLELVPMCVFLFAPSVINANLIFDWVLIEFSDF